LLGWIKRLFGGEAPRPVGVSRTQQEARTLDDFQRHFQLQFSDPELLRLALTHRSYLSVTGQGPRASNERLEFLGDSVLGLVTSEFLYRLHPDEHEGELTKNKSLLVSKAILSRRALAMGLGRFVLMSHSEVESGGRQRLSILADAFEAVIGAVYLDQGFEAGREFIHRWLLREAGEIVADKRHTNYKSHLQEYVQSTWRTHPVYRIRSEMGPDHSKHFLVEVMVGKRNLGEGRGRNKKEAEQAAARDALEKAGAPREAATHPREDVEERRRDSESRRGDSEFRRGGAERNARPGEEREPPRSVSEPVSPGAATVEDEDDDDEALSRRRRRGRRGGRGRRREGGGAANEPIARAPAPESEGRLATPSHRLAPIPGLESEPEPIEDSELEPPPLLDEDDEEVGRPEGPHEELHVDPYAMRGEPATSSRSPEPWSSEPPLEVRSEDEGGEPDETRDLGDEAPIEPAEPSTSAPERERRDAPQSARVSEPPRRNFGRRRGRR
jgi:ribonuclease-3